MKKGDYFYYINEYGKFLRKVSWSNDYYFEWNGGWANLEELIPNDDTKSKVKFILKEL